MKTFRVTKIFFAAALAAAGLALPVSAATATGDARYQPHLAPVFTAGQAFSYQATATTENSMRITRSQVNDDTHAPEVLILENKDTEYSSQLVADAAVARTVFPNGWLREAVLLVKSCTLVFTGGKNAGQTETLVPPGTVIAFRVLDDGRVAFAINGQTISAWLAATQSMTEQAFLAKFGRTVGDELASRLSELIPQLGEAKYNYDGLFGPPAPVSVGESWKVNEMALLNSVLPQVFPGVTQVNGSVRFKGVNNGVATYAGIYSLVGVEPLNWLPPQVAALPSQANFGFEESVPLAGGPGEYRIQTNALVQHEGQTGNINEGISETRVTVKLSLDLDARFTLAQNLRPLAQLLSAPLVPKDAEAKPPGAIFAPGVEEVPGASLSPLTANIEAAPATSTSTPQPVATVPSAPKPVPPPTPAPQPHLGWSGVSALPPQPGSDNSPPRGSNAPPPALIVPSAGSPSSFPGAESLPPQPNPATPPNP